MLKLKARGTFFDIAFDDLLPIIRSKPVFLILDRDGTLVPICEHPTDAKLSLESSEIIHRTARLLEGRMAIVSARSLANLESEFDPNSIILAGNYGMEIKGPADWQFLHPVANQSQLEVDHAKLELTKLLKMHPELILDDHCFSLCLHTHKLPEVHHEKINALLSELKEKFFTLKFRRSASSYEVLPLLEWKKSDALDKIAENLRLNNQDLAYVAFGDADADESLFKWSNERFGLSFLVGNRLDSFARGVVSHPSSVIEFMRQLCCVLEEAQPSRALSS